MDKAEQFIKDCTNHCSNLMVFAKGDKEYDYAPWLTPEQALRAVEISKEGVIEALRTEYEKGRADVIADTLSWLENCWPKYCSNQTIIEGYKEATKE